MAELLPPALQREEYERPPSEREISIQEIIKIILRRKWGILAILSAAFFLTLFFHSIQTPEYRADSILMINNTDNKGDLMEAIMGPNAVVDEKVTKKDMELLKSMPIAELTVKDLYKSNRRDSLEFLGNKHYFSWLTGPMEPVILFFKQSQKKKTPDEILRDFAIKLNKRIKVDAIRQTNLLKVSVSSPFPDEAAFLSNTLCKVYKESDVDRNSEKYTQANQFITDMLQDQQKKVSDADNAQAKYMQSHQIYELTGNTQSLLDKLIDSDSKYYDVKAEYNITKNSLAFLDKKLTDGDRALSSQISQNVTAQLGNIMDEIKTREREYIQLISQKGAKDEEAKSKRQELDVVKARYDQLSKSKIAGLIGYAGKAQKVNFDMVSEKMEIERKLNELNFRALEMGKLKQYYDSQLSTLPTKQQEYAKILRDHEVVNKTYTFLKSKLDESRILLGSEVGSVSLVGDAFKPFKPESPDLKKNLLLGLVLGGLLSAMYAYGAETVDDSVKDESYFKDLGLPILSYVPLVTREGKSSLSMSGESRLSRLLYNQSKAFREKLLLTGSTSNGNKPYVPKVEEIPMPTIMDSLTSPFAESFRTLRTALDYSRIDTPLKSILISGTAMSEGKSTVCANLGMSLALTGKKTLIVDCDLRRASLHKKFGKNREPGLTDYLFSSEHSIDDRYFQSTEMDNLYLLSAGKKLQNCNELLGSAKMKTLIQELEGKFDKILFDSPPLFLSDAAQLASSVDGILLAARLQFTSRRPLHDFTTDHYLRPLMLGVAVIESSDQGLFGYGYGKYGYGKYGYGKYGYGKYGYSRYGYGQYEEKA
ncbi:MAG: polysaccharide biosynthesis tyrosine autokinase [Chlorobium sp.]|nr:MAG: polysaccharide biosynthesis tyrosine autokinase [Chlorobium sp.]